MSDLDYCDLNFYLRKRYAIKEQLAYFQNKDFVKFASEIEQLTTDLYFVQLCIDALLFGGYKNGNN